MQHFFIPAKLIPDQVVELESITLDSLGFLFTAFKEIDNFLGGCHYYFVKLYELVSCRSYSFCYTIGLYIVKQKKEPVLHSTCGPRPYKSFSR